MEFHCWISEIHLWSLHWNALYGRTPVEYIVLKVQVNFPYSLPCWDTVGCKWGTTFVYYFEITYVCFITIILSVFAMGPQYQFWFFFKCMSKMSFEGQKQNLRKISCRLRVEWGLYVKYRLSWKCRQFDVFFSYPFDILSGATYANMLVATLPSEVSTLLPGGHSVTTEACTSPAKVCVVWTSGSSLELSALCLWKSVIMGVRLPWHYLLKSEI